MDIQILLWLQNIRYALGWIENFFVLLTSYSLGIGVVISCILYWGSDRKTGCFILLNAVTGNFSNNLLKNLFHVPRPWVRNEQITPNLKAKASATGYSFPSGHSEMAGSVFGTMGMAYKKYRWICFLLVAGIGFSRMFLGVHAPQDVFCGILESVGIYLALEKVYRFLEDAKIQRIVLYVSFSLAVLLFLMLALQTNGFMQWSVFGNDELMQGAGLFLGFFSGMAIEREYIDLKNTEKYLEIIYRVFCGILVTGAVYIITGKLEMYGFCFVRYYIVAITVMALVPFTIVKLLHFESRIEKKTK